MRNLVCTSRTRPTAEMASASLLQQTFTMEDAKAALEDILDSFQNAENAARLEEARQSSGNDMLKLMQTFFPVATQIQMEVIQNYGFPANGEGVVRFTQTIKMFERQDPEISRLYAKLHSFVIPKMAAPAPQAPPS